MLSVYLFVIVSGFPCNIIKLVSIFFHLTRVMVFSVLSKGRDQIRTPGGLWMLISASFHIWVPLYLINTEVCKCLIYNYCLHSVHILEHNVKGSLLPVGILCSGWARPG